MRRGSNPDDELTARVENIKSAHKTMIRFLKNRFTRFREPLQQSALGPLEISIMEVLWGRGESNVRDVAEKLDRRLAYTTVMTTLDRLFKKGLLDRRKLHRSFMYLPKLSRQEWEQKRAGELVAGFLAGPEPSRELLLSCFLDVVGGQDVALLDELEKKIRTRRREPFRRRDS
jgi:predicted transcriptional regulator